MFVVMEESRITITHYVLLAKNVQKYDVLNTIKKRKKLLEKAKLYRKNNKDKPKQNGKSFSSHAEDIQNLHKKIDVITEMLKSTTSVS